MKVCFAGGLGNQLFQLAAGYGLSKENVIEGIFSFGNYVNYSYEISEIKKVIDLNLVLADEKKFPNTIERKSWNYLLRTSGGHQPSLRNPVEKISKMVLHKYFGSADYIHTSKSLGYDGKISPSSESDALIGYFRTYKWAEESNIAKSAVKVGFETLAPRLSYFNNKRPIIAVHIRLGDYRSNHDLGILNKKYYEEALSIAFQGHADATIWLFSNEPEQALEWIPKSLLGKVFTIPKDVFSPAETINLMRLADVNITANSTFSWWGAYLNSKDSQVICPSQWFKNLPEPIALIPNRWHRVQNGWF